MNFHTVLKEQVIVTQLWFSTCISFLSTPSHLMQTTLVFLLTCVGRGHNLCGGFVSYCEWASEKGTNVQMNVFNLTKTIAAGKQKREDDMVLILRSIVDSDDSL